MQVSFCLKAVQLCDKMYCNLLAKIASHMSKRLDPILKRTHFPMALMLLPQSKVRQEGRGKVLGFLV